MKVYKFGGASIKDPAAVRNMAEILAKGERDNILVVVSAMGKTTNALEEVWRNYYQSKDLLPQSLKVVHDFHFKMVEELFVEPGSKQELIDDLSNVFVELDWILEEDPHPDKNFTYDQIVSLGEILSSKIIAAYLKSIQFPIQWLDARNYIATDNSYRDAEIDWDKCSTQSEELLQKIKNQLLITQGFIGSTSENYTTTLGREGSDYTAAIFAHLLNAESVTIWKDVPGVLTADPKLFPQASRIPKLPYAEALEMTYYGATVIHPKTIKPLQNKGIPLLVRAFNAYEEPGTKIADFDLVQFSEPTIIVKKNQLLLSISTKDFSFIAEHNLAELLEEMSIQHIKVNVLQNSAMTVSMVIDQAEDTLARITPRLGEKYKVKYNEGLELVTIRHYHEAVLSELSANRKVILEQRSRSTVQLLLK